VEAAAIEGIRGKLDRAIREGGGSAAGGPGEGHRLRDGEVGADRRKIAATLASTGTPAFFLHPAEGIHGDIGMVRRGDVVIALSNSGETEEIVRLLPVFQRMGLPVIALTGTPAPRSAGTRT